MESMLQRKYKLLSGCLLAFLLLNSSSGFAGEADIKITDLDNVSFNVAGRTVNGVLLLYAGLAICGLGVLFGLVQYQQTNNLPVHKSMRAVSQTIWETCKTYL